jgi:predicted XRE-type DNA-binding protein
VPEIEVMARDLIEVMTDTTDFAMDIQLQLPPEVGQHRRRATELRTEELRIRSEAAAELRTAARVLRQQGLALRDVGTLLGVSTARAGQLVGTGR